MTGRATSGARPRRTARRSAISSSRPRLPGGLVRLSRWRRAALSPSREGGATAGAANREVREPGRGAVAEDPVVRVLETTQTRDEIARRFHRRPALRALGTMAGDALGHVLVACLGGRDEDDSRVG